MDQKTSVRRKGYFLFTFFLFTALGLSRPAVGQTAPAIEGIEYKSSDSLIQAFVLISAKDTIRYSLISGSEEGVKTLQIYSGEKLITRKECYGAKNCRISGVTPTVALETDILTVEAISTSQKEQKEKIKMNLAEGGDKVYMITALPEMIGQSAELIASATGTEAPASGTQPVEISRTADTGPVITLQVLKKDKNTYNLLIVSADPYGIDFIELLQNARFYDVQECASAKQCKMEKTIVVKSQEKASFSVKAMNKNAKVSYQDIPLTFED